jgi:hypothetical protein
MGFCLRWWSGRSLRGCSCIASVAPSSPLATPPLPPRKSAARRGSLFWLRLLLTVAVLPALFLSPATAQSPAAQQDPAELYHWAYAAAFGTGAYRYGDTSVFILRLAPEYEIRAPDDRTVGIALTFPFTLGIQFSDLEGILEGELPNQFQTVSFVPGVTLRIPMSPEWVLKPSANVGWGKELSGSDEAWIYHTGIDSRYRFGTGNARFGLLNGLQYYGYTPKDGPADKFFRFLTGLELDYPFFGVTARGRPLFIKPHCAWFYYFGELDILSIQGPSVELKQEWELALAVGPEKPVSLWGLEFDRIGLAYRVSKDIEGVRLFFTSLFE